MNRFPLRLVAVAGALALTAVACGSDDTTSTKKVVVVKKSTTTTALASANTAPTRRSWS